MLTAYRIARIITLLVPGKKRRKTWRKKVEDSLTPPLKPANKKEIIKATKKIEKFQTDYADLLEDKNYELISLGSDCFARTLPTRWGLMSSKRQGYLSCPFDLSQHSPLAVLECIKNDFSCYFENIEQDPETKFWLNRKANIIYNHDEDLSDFGAFIERYQNRIKNFRELVKTDKPLFFIFHYKSKNYKHFIDTNYTFIIEAFELLKKKRGSKISKLIIINPLKKIKIKHSDDILIINEPLYNQKYCWFKDYQTTPGCLFEYNIIRKSAHFIKSVLKIDPYRK